jgi:inosine/xanthosine triphosphatase
MNIIIGSKNPAKIQAVQNAFSNQYKFHSIDVPSNVNEQPFSDEETIQGAINRAELALQLGQGEIGIGLEGGVQESPLGLFLCNWGALVLKGHPPLIAGGARILLPEDIAQKLRNGNELGPVMDEFSKKQNIRQKEGAIGIFTKGLISRVDMFTHVTTLLVGQYKYYYVNEILSSNKYQ